MAELSGPVEEALDKANQLIDSMDLPIEQKEAMRAKLEQHATGFVSPSQEKASEQGIEAVGEMVVGALQGDRGTYSEGLVRATSDRSTSAIAIVMLVDLVEELMKSSYVNDRLDLRFAEVVAKMTRRHKEESEAGRPQ